MSTLVVITVAVMMMFEIRRNIENSYSIGINYSPRFISYSNWSRQEGYTKSYLELLVAAGVRKFRRGIYKYTTSYMCLINRIFFT